MIGWVTNYLAIRMLFRPLNPVRVPLTGWVWQGVLPKRRGAMARSLGRAVERDLISAGVIVDRLVPPELVERLAGGAVDRVRDRMNRGLAFLPPPLREVAVRMAGDIARREAEDYLAETVERLRSDFSQRLDLAGMVEEKVKSFSLDELERLILDLTARELRHIEVFGGALGFLIGLVQIVISKALFL